MKENQNDLFLKKVSIVPLAYTMEKTQKKTEILSILLEKNVMKTLEEIQHFSLTSLNKMDYDHSKMRLENTS